MRFAFVGLGSAARELHLRALAGVRGAAVVGGCDEAKEARAAWTRATGVEAFRTAEELLARRRPEVVVVATPPPSHADLCVQALEGGAHVLCEKPLATSAAEAERILVAARSASRQVAVNHHFRCQPIFHAIKRRIESDEYGRLVFCQLSQTTELAPWDEAVAWRAAMADRALLEGSVHLVDLLLHLFGSAPTSVWASVSGGDADRDADAIQLVTLDFGDGRLGQLSVNRLSAAATRYAELRASCARATLGASVGGRALLAAGKQRARRAGVRLELAAGGVAWIERGQAHRTIARNPRRASVRATADLLAGSVAAFRDGHEPPCPGREARDAVATIEAAYRSARTGTRVIVDSPAAVIAARADEGAR
jgi:predicted dehydrogenase